MSNTDFTIYKKTKKSFSLNLSGFVESTSLRFNGEISVPIGTRISQVQKIPEIFSQNLELSIGEIRQTRAGGTYIFKARDMEDAIRRLKHDE